MDKATVLVGGVVALALIGGLVFFLSQTPSSNNSNTTTNTQPGSENTEGTMDTPTAPAIGGGANATPTDTTVVLTGMVTPKGAPASYWYEYGTTESLGKKTSEQSIGAGFVSYNAPAYITGLTKNTKYFFKLVAQNAIGTTEGAQYSFVTTDGVPAPSGSAPTVSTSPATSVSNNSAALAGIVDPNQSATQYWFEYGKTNTFGSVTDISSVGDGTAALPASATLSSLQSGTTYFYRLNAQNKFGTVNGATLSFKTSGQVSQTAPTGTTKSAINLSTSTATLRGTVDPGGAVTTYWFEITSDSAENSSNVRKTEQKTIGGTEKNASVEALVSGLTSGTTYYYRLVVQNSNGIGGGQRMSLKTR